MSAAVPRPVRRILVIQLRQLGDLLMITPLLRALSRRHPGAELAVLCEPAGRIVLEHNARLARLHLLPRKAGAADLWRMALDLRRQAYDLVVDCQGLPKTALLARASGAPLRLGFAGPRQFLYTHAYRRSNADYSALDKLKLLQDPQVDLADLDLEFPLPERARQDAAAFVAQHFRPPVAALFGVSRRAYKVWPPENLARIGDRLAGAGYQPFLVYGPGEEEAARGIAARMEHPALVDYPMPDFPALAGILSHCALFVGNDGGPKHLAALAGVPTVTVYGHVHPEAWTRPDNPDQRWVATASSTREQPTAGPCEPALRLDEIPVDALWNQVLDLARMGRIPRLETRA